MIFEINNSIPVISQKAFIHPQSCIIGNVIIEDDVYIGPFASLRADMGKIIVKKGSNIQDNCTIHMFPGETVILENNSHIGHGAIIHGAYIGENVMVGMNSVIMDKVVLKKNCFVGAMSFVKSKDIFEENSLIIGNPAKFVRYLEQREIDWKKEGTRIYQVLANDSLLTHKQCDALSNIDEQIDSSEKYNYNLKN